MKRREFFNRSLGSALVLGLTEIATRIPLLGEGDQVEYRVRGTYFAGCACRVPCPCEFAGTFKEGCNNLEVIVLTSGSYKGADLSGVKLVEAGLAGKWTRIYIDAPDAKHDAAATFAKNLFVPYGKNEAITKAKVDFSGRDGSYKLTVGSGKIVEMATELILGADQKNPIKLTNVYAAFGPTVTQARTLKGMFQDGGHSFTLENSNSVFIDPLNTSGRFEAT
jgi:hypothetical protein